MSEKRNIVYKCPNCSQGFVIPIEKSMIGTIQKFVCPNCKKPCPIKLPTSFISLFETDLTQMEKSLKTTSLSLQMSLIKDDSTSMTYQSFNISADSTVVGRKSDNPSRRADVEIETKDTLMSRKHAIIRKVKNFGFTLREYPDCKNGIRLNGEKLDKETEIYLNEGDVVCFGKTKFLINLIRYSLKDEDVIENK